MMERVSGILSIRKLRKDFGRVEALKEIDITIDKPGVYGFLGPNGAGKTTTFKLVSGLLAPTSGTIRICGIDVHRDTNSAMKHLGVLFDVPSYYPYMTGRDNLEVFARWSGRNLSTQILELLSMVGLENAMTKKVGEYSWGMKRRLGIAAALLGDPELVLLDEPTNGLDPAGIADIRNLLPGLAHDHGRTVLLSSHRMEEVDQICDHVTIINRGEIIASGSVAELSKAEPVVEIVCDDADSAKALLSRYDGIDDIEMTGAGSLRILAPGMSAAVINRILIEGGIQVRQVLEKRESLEETFFRLTGTHCNDE